MNKQKTLQEVITAKSLRSKAGSVYYSRGVGYFEDDCVDRLEIGEDYVSAIVHGSYRYKVKLSVVSNILYGTCNCPLGQDREFCKHQVALGLAYIHADNQAKKQKNKSTFNWTRFVKECTREEVEKIVFEMSVHCPKIIEKYRMENLPVTENALALELNSKIDSLVAMAEDCGYDDYDDYYDDYDEDDCNCEFSDGQRQLEIALDKIADKEDYTVLFKIAEYGIEQIRLTSTYQEEPVSEFLDSMLNYYIQAASFGIGTPEYLVNKIQTWEQNDSYCGFGNLKELFPELSQATKDLWYENAIKEWERMPALKMGSSSRNNYRRRLETRLLYLAKEHKNQKLILKIRKNNLSETSDVLALIDEYRACKMDKEILPLLQKAKSVFSNSRDIRNALTQEQQKLGNHDAALKIAWKEFENSPLCDEAFSFLIKTARQAKCSPEYLEKALKLLEEKELKQSNQRSYWGHNHSIRSRRIEILLDAGRNEQAWELGKDAHCYEELKLRLAKWRSKKNPTEAGEVCNQLLKKALVPTGDREYEHVIKLLKLYKEYMNMAEKQEQFQQYCQWIRTEYRRRKNLLALMSRHKF